MARNKKNNQSHGFLMILGLFVLSTLLMFTSVGLGRSVTELTAVNRAVALSQALHLADAGVDAAIDQLLNNPAFSDPAFTGHTTPTDWTSPLIIYPSGPTGGTFTIERLPKNDASHSTFLNPFSTRSNGTSGFAEEERFEVTATGTVPTIGQRRVQAIVARARTWTGGAAMQWIYIQENTSGGTVSSPVYPGDETDIYGDLRTNWGSIRTWGAMPGNCGGTPSSCPRPVQIPAGAHVHGGITIGPPIEDPPGFTAAEWTAYARVSTDPLPSVGYSDGVWVGPAATHTLGNASQVSQHLVFGDPAFNNPASTKTYNPAYGYPTNPAGYPSTYTLPAGTVDSTPKAVSTGALIPNVSAQVTPPTGMDCSTVFNSNLPIPGELLHTASVVKMPGGVYCYTTYTVQPTDTVYYTGPATIYVLEAAANPLVTSFGERSNVGVTVNPADTPTNPPYDPITNTSSKLLDGGVSFRTTSSKIVGAFCLSHVHGSIIAPNATFTYHHNSGFDDPRGTVYGSYLTNQIQVRDGTLARFFADGGASLGPWVRVVSWLELPPSQGP